MRYSFVFAFGLLMYPCVFISNAGDAQIVFTKTGRNFQTTKHLLLFHFQSSQKAEWDVTTVEKVIFCIILFHNLKWHIINSCAVQNKLQKVTLSVCYKKKPLSDICTELKWKVRKMWCFSNEKQILWVFFLLFIRCNKGITQEETINEIKEKIKTRTNAFFDMEAFLPKKNG